MKSNLLSHSILIFAVLAFCSIPVTSQTTEHPGQWFNTCLSAIAPESLEKPGFAVIADELQRVPEYRRTKWNVNRPHQHGAINLVIPAWDSSFWPGSVCGNLPLEPAACAVSPQEKAIVCNPAMGRQLSAPLVQSRIAATNEDFALNFILLTVIGHELGHIRLGGKSAVEHLLHIQSLDGANCYRRPEGVGPTNEEKADEIGLSIACTGLRNRPDRKELPTDPGDVLMLLSRVEDNLDDAYFAIDDLCTGDERYPSVSRRKISFANRYLNCLYPAGYEPLKLLNESLLSDFNDLEKWLTARQVSGHAADGNYGTRPLANQLVSRSPSRDVSVAFDSTDHDSSFWFITAQPNNMLSFVQSKSWDRTGIAVGSDVTASSTRLLLFLNPSDDSPSPSLVELTIQCDGAKCLANENARTDLVPDSILMKSLQGSYALVTRTGVQFFASEEQLFSSHGSFNLRKHNFNTGPDTLVVAVGKSDGMVTTREAGGLYKVAFLGPDSFDTKVLVTVPHTIGTLESAAIVIDRLLLVFSESPELGPTSVTLWDCPYDLIRRGIETVSCTAYKAPDAVEIPAALASHNGSSFSDRFVDPSLACADYIVVHHGGWLWLLDRHRQLNDLLFADGIVSCSAQADTIETYRARRVDTLKLEMRKVESSVVPLSIIPPNPEISKQH